MRIVRYAIVLVIGSLVIAAGTAHAVPRPVTADTVQRLCDELVADFQAGDPAAAAASVADLDSILTALSSQDTSATRSAADDLPARIAEAQRLTDQLAAGLAGLDTAGPAESGRINLPPLPGPLGALSSLFDALLASLFVLIASLLGGLPAPPLPVPPLPVPVPVT